MLVAMTTAAPYSSLATIPGDAGRFVASHLDRTFRRMLRGEGVVETPEFVRLITGQPHPFGNLAIFSHEPAADDVAAAIEPLVHCGAPAAAIFTNTVGADAHARLTSAGFQPAGAMPAMAVEIDSLPATSMPQECAMVRVGAGPDADAWTATFAVGYELPRPVAEWFSPNAARATTDERSPIQYFVALKRGRPVATSMLHLADGVAGIYCVATTPEDRRQGLGAHLTAEPLRLARRQGYRVGILQASHAGHPIYRGLGFQDLGGLPLYVRMPT